MKLVVIGDSISVGTFTDKSIGQTGPGSIASPNFAEYVQSMIGADELENYGVNGISYCSLSPVNSHLALTKTYGKIQDADVILIAAGTNDYGTHVELGQKEDREDSSFYGAVDFVLRNIKENNPQAKIYVILPIPRLDDWANQKGYTLEQYREAIEYKAALYGLFVIDGRKLPVNPKIEEEMLRFMDDGVHPNQLGHKLYAEMVYSQMIQ